MLLTMAGCHPHTVGMAPWPGDSRLKRCKVDNYSIYHPSLIYEKFGKNETEGSVVQPFDIAHGRNCCVIACTTQMEKKYVWIKHYSCLVLYLSFQMSPVGFTRHRL